MARPRAGGNLDAIRSSVSEAHRHTVEPPAPGRVRLPAQGVQSTTRRTPSGKRSATSGDNQHALDASFRKNFRRQLPGEVKDEDFRWIEPTSTSNPSRPRTMQAGYNAKAREMRIIFREGAKYSYYGVEPVVWQRFRRVVSPGRFINRTLNNYPYEREPGWER